jgi:hypothetical protein
MIKHGFLAFAMALLGSHTVASANTIFLGSGGTDGAPIVWVEGQDICKDNIVTFGIDQNPCGNQFTFDREIPGWTFRFERCGQSAPLLNVKKSFEDDSAFHEISTCQFDGRTHACGGSGNFPAKIAWQCPFADLPPL